MSDLLPCPFCGGKARLVVGAVMFVDAEVHCDSCAVQSGNYDGGNQDANCAEAIAAWNRRAPSAAYRAGAEAMRERAAGSVEGQATGLVATTPDAPRWVFTMLGNLAAAIRALPLPEAPEEPK